MRWGFAVNAAAYDDELPRRTTTLLRASLRSEH